MARVLLSFTFAFISIFSTPCFQASLSSNTNSESTLRRISKPKPFSLISLRLSNLELLKPKKRWGKQRFNIPNRFELASLDNVRSKCLQCHPITGSQVHEDGVPQGEIDSKRVSVSLFVTYLTVMGAKCALPSTLSLLTSPQSGLIHQSTTRSLSDSISRLLAFSTLSIAAGKLLLGPVIDSVGGVKSLQVALFTLFMCLGLIGMGPQTCPSIHTFTLYWIIVDFAFSSCWAACVKTIRDYVDEKKWSREVGRLAMAARIGNAISFALFAWILQWGHTVNRHESNVLPVTPAEVIDASWRRVFCASSVAQLIPLVLLSQLGHDKRGESIKSAPSVKHSLAILSQLSTTPEFWLHLVSRSILMVLMSFLLFIPTYMHQCFQVASASAARVGSIFALGCLLSILSLAEKTYPSSDKLTDSETQVSKSTARRKKKYLAMMSFLSVSIVCLLVHFAFLQNIIQLSPIQGTLLMFLWGFTLAIPFYLPASMFALKRGGRDGSATIADVFDVCGFGLLAVFNSIVARVLEVGTNVMTGMVESRKKAWAPIFLWMIGGSIISMLSLIFAVQLEDGRD